MILYPKVLKLLNYLKTLPKLTKTKLDLKYSRILTILQHPYLNRTKTKNWTKSKPNIINTRTDPKSLKSKTINQKKKNWTQTEPKPKPKCPILVRKVSSYSNTEQFWSEMHSHYISGTLTLFKITYLIFSNQVNYTQIIDVCITPLGYGMSIVNMSLL